MGKGDLWDDSALIKALDSAVSKYKMMHGIGGSTDGIIADNNTEEFWPDAEANNENNEFSSVTEDARSDGKINAAPETTHKIGETDNHVKIKENPSLELYSSTNHGVSSNGQTGNLSSTSKSPALESSFPDKHPFSSDVKSQNEAVWCSNGQEGYDQLLNKYYEIEDQRQRVLQQLDQYTNWNYQNSGQYQAFVTQPYNSISCSCSYGCQNWVVPDDSSPTCLGGPHADNRNDILNGSQKGEFMSQQCPDIVQTAMVAAKGALSSLPQEPPSIADTSVKEAKDKESGTRVGNFTYSTEPATDLTVVLNAWYSAGFYTGKYLSEQSLEKVKRQ